LTPSRTRNVKVKKKKELFGKSQSKIKPAFPEIKAACINCFQNQQRAPSKGQICSENGLNPDNSFEGTKTSN
jgi:hypothetical protein